MATNAPHPSSLLYGEAVRDHRDNPKRVRTWLVKDHLGERLVIHADEVSTSNDALTFRLDGLVVACINGWHWYRLHASDVPKT